MKRREFIRLLGGAAAGAPLAARAQQGAGMPRIGVLLANAKEHPLTAPSVAAFTKALQELGWVEGQNVRIDYRWAASDLERMQVFAKELVSLQPSVVVGQSTPVVVALKRETKTIPIVFISIAEPVKSGLVASLSHPGGPRPPQRAKQRRSQSCSFRLPSRSKAVSLPACHIPAATSRASATSNRRWPASGSRYSRTLFRA